MNSSRGYRVVHPLLGLTLVLSLAACGDRPAPKTTPPDARSAAPPPALKVHDWGPRQTTRGMAVNRQPDGTSAIWIRVSGVKADPATRVTFGGQHASSATVTPDLVTAAVPPAVISSAGAYPVTIEEPGGRQTAVGSFVVQQ